jgi:hypothetical protein
MSRTLHWREPPHERDEHYVPMSFLPGWFGDHEQPRAGEPVTLENTPAVTGFIRGMMVHAPDGDREELQALITALLTRGSVELVIRN